MVNRLPTADELRDSLHRDKPGRFLESMGLLGVIGCAIAGVVIALEIGGQASALLLGAGACLGMTAGVLAYWLVLYLLGYHRSPAVSSFMSMRAKLTPEQRQARARLHQSSDELIPSNRGDVKVFYTEVDFLCPPSMPGSKSQVGGNFCDLFAKSGEIAFAVVQPQRDASSQELQAIGERLQAWQAGNEHVRRILGLEQLLKGSLPVLRADMFSLAAMDDQVRVALVYVVESADNKTTGEDLLQVLNGLPVDVVSPGYFSMMRM